MNRTRTRHNKPLIKKRKTKQVSRQNFGKVNNSSVMCKECGAGEHLLFDCPSYL
jgi:hypothetical protein